MLPDVALLKATAPTEVPATPRVIFDVPSEVMPATVFGAVPAPPPSIGEPDAKRADDDSCVVELKYGTPPEVTVPATVTGNDGVPPIAQVQTAGFAAVQLR